MDMVNPRRIRALGFRCCGCLLLIVIATLALCVLLFVLVFRLVNPIHAAEMDATARHYTFLVDQSRSVVNTPEAQMLAREATEASLIRLRSFASNTDMVRIIFFGARATTTAITATRLLDPALDARVSAAFDQSASLGGTPLAEVLADLLNALDSTTDVILITDGIPDSDSTQSAADRIIYAQHLRDLGAMYARRGVTVSIVLVGLTPRAEWLPAWQDLAATAKGIVLMVQKPEDVSRVEQAFAAFAPIATPVPTADVAVTHVPNPTATPQPSPTKTSTAQPIVSNPPKTNGSTFPWLPVIVGTALVAGLIGAWFIRSRPAAKTAELIPSDEGVLEICDPQTGDMQRIELRDLALGEVWGIGNSPQSRIRLGRDVGEEEYAVLVFGPEGPRIESRGVPMWFDGHPVKTHLLFDGDDVYLSRFVIGYQNFFRRRDVVDVEEEIGM
ncbi:MAG TPA: vWA domain-containing protein [Anaerolineae bacterium]